MMDPNDVNNVVNNAADKLGAALEKLGGVAGDIIQGYQYSRIAACIACFLIMVGLLLVLRKALPGIWKAIASVPEGQGMDDATIAKVAVCVSVSILSVFCLIPTGISMVEFGMQAVAPAYYCLKNLL